MDKDLRDAGHRGGGLKTLARDRRTLGRMALQVGLPRASSEFVRDFWQSPPALSSIPQWILGVDCVKECLSKRAKKNDGNCQNEAQDAPGTLPGESQNGSRGHFSAETHAVKFLKR